MKITRRSLLSSSTVAAVAASHIAWRGPSQTAPLAGLGLVELQKLYEKELRDDLGYWKKHGIDAEHGGFMCAMDHDGTILSSEKNVTFQGRGIWIYSFLYNHFGKNPEHLEVARKAKEFLFKYARTRDSIWPQVLSREGVVTEPFKGQIYEGLYVALGLQEYARASGESEAMEEAVKTFLKCMEFYDRPDYGTAGVHSPPPGSRLQAVEMVIIDLLTQMLENDSDPRLQNYQDRTVRMLVEKFFNPEFQLHNEALSHNYERYSDKLWRDHVQLGFSIANFWGMLFEALRRRDQNMFKTVAERLRRHLEVAWDDVYGGLGRFTKVEEGCVDYQKVAYVHEEAMIGLLSIIEQLGESWARAWYDRVHHYAFEKFPIRRYPGWHSYMDRKCTPQEHVKRRENFHHPRFLMHNLLIIGRLLQKN